MRVPGADQAIANLIKWSAKDEWSRYQAQLFDEHFRIVEQRFDISTREIGDLLGDAYRMVFGFVPEDFFTTRFGDEGERNVIDDYLNPHSPDEMQFLAGGVTILI